MTQTLASYDRWETMVRHIAVVLALGVAAAGPAGAQQAAPAAGPMPGMTMPPAGAGAPSSAAFKAADDKMMAAMGGKLTGNADQDFVAGMLPHHQGAVDMARVELQYGHDPVLRRLARDIIAAQQREIALMQAWRSNHPP